MEELPRNDKDTEHPLTSLIYNFKCIYQLNILYPFIVGTVRPRQKILQYLALPSHGWL